MTNNSIRLQGTLTCEKALLSYPTKTLIILLKELLSSRVLNHMWYKTK